MQGPQLLLVWLQCSLGLCGVAIVQQALYKWNALFLSIKFIRRGQSLGKAGTPGVFQRWPCVFHLFSTPVICCLLWLHGDFQKEPLHKVMCWHSPYPHPRPFPHQKSTYHFSAHWPWPWGLPKAFPLRAYIPHLRNNCWTPPFVFCPSNKCI